MSVDNPPTSELGVPTIACLHLVVVNILSEYEEW